MTTRPLHRTSIELMPQNPPKVGIGSNASYKARVACSFGCDLLGGRVIVVDDEGEPQFETELVKVRSSRSETDEFTLTAPESEGIWTWGLIYEGDVGTIADHEASATLVDVDVTSNSITIAVWDVPTMAVVGEPLSIKIGATSSSKMPLAGCKVTVTDASGEVWGEGWFGSQPWQGTCDLYWTEVAMNLPDIEGSVELVASFQISDSSLPHDPVEHRFYMTLARPPEMTLAVTILDTATGEPIPHAVVRLKESSPSGVANVQMTERPFMPRAVTDVSGQALLRANRGRYAVCAFKANFEIESPVIDLSESRSLKMAAVYQPKKKKEKIWG